MFSNAVRGHWRQIWAPKRYKYLSWTQLLEPLTFFKIPEILIFAVLKGKMIHHLLRSSRSGLDRDQISRADLQRKTKARTKFKVFRRSPTKERAQCKVGTHRTPEVKACWKLKRKSRLKTKIECKTSVLDWESDALYDWDCAESRRRRINENRTTKEAAHKNWRYVEIGGDSVRKVVRWTLVWGNFKPQKHPSVKPFTRSQVLWDEYLSVGNGFSPN